MILSVIKFIAQTAKLYLEYYRRRVQYKKDMRCLWLQEWVPLYSSCAGLAREVVNRELNSNWYLPYVKICRSYQHQLFILFSVTSTSRVTHHAPSLCSLPARKTSTFEFFVSCRNVSTRMYVQWSVHKNSQNKKTHNPSPFHNKRDSCAPKKLKAGKRKAKSKFSREESGRWKSSDTFHFPEISTIGKERKLHGDASRYFSVAVVNGRNGRVKEVSQYFLHRMPQ